MRQSVADILRTITDRIMRGGNVMALHELFRETLAGLQLRGSLRGTEYAVSVSSKFIDDTQLQRQLRADHSEIRLDALRQGQQRINTLDVSRQTFSVGRRSGVAGCAIKLRNTRRLAQFPNQRMLASTTSDDENPHSSGQTRLGVAADDVKPKN